MATPLVEMRDISIAFGGIKAVDHASVEVHPGEVMGLLGHNGAGKSTLIKILSGAYRRDQGKIFVNGEEAHIENPRDAKDYGIETIYQTLALADNVDAAANLFLGREIMTTLGDARRRRDGGESTRGDGPAESEFQAVQGAGEVFIRWPAAIGGYCARHSVRSPNPDHGRADSSPWAAGNRTGGRTDQAAQGGRHRHLPDQP